LGLFPGLFSDWFIPKDEAIMARATRRLRGPGRPAGALDSYKRERRRDWTRLNLVWNLWPYLEQGATIQSAARQVSLRGPLKELRDDHPEGFRKLIMRIRRQYPTRKALAEAIAKQSAKQSKSGSSLLRVYRRLRGPHVKLRNYKRSKKNYKRSRRGG
jgi:hypothetical protein